MKFFLLIVLSTFIMWVGASVAMGNTSPQSVVEAPEQTLGEAVNMSVIGCGDTQIYNNLPMREVVVRNTNGAAVNAYAYQQKADGSRQEYFLGKFTDIGKYQVSWDAPGVGTLTFGLMIEEICR